MGVANHLNFSCFSRQSQKDHKSCRGQFSFFKGCSCFFLSSEYEIIHWIALLSQLFLSLFLPPLKKINPDVSLGFSFDCIKRY